jgi:hypothetical protein
MNAPRNRGSIQLRNNRGSVNMRSGTERGSILMPEQEELTYDFNAFFAPPPSRWEQSSSFGEYCYFVWSDFQEWCQTLDFQVIKEYIIYILERFTVNITVS